MSCLQTGFYVDDAKEKAALTEAKKCLELQDVQTNGKTEIAETELNPKDDDSKEVDEVDTSDKAATADPEEHATDKSETPIKMEEESVKQEAEVKGDQNEEIEEVEVEEFFVKYKNL
jgi:hypothetical protein